MCWDWDDLSYFIAVAGAGSVRAAAEHLGVTHSTVLRRVSQLEELLGALIFDKLPSGYRLTAAGEEVLEFAEQMVSASNQLETRVSGRDQGVLERLRVTLTPMLATHLLMPDLAEFARHSLPTAGSETPITHAASPTPLLAITMRSASSWASVRRG
jgi:DNA-binding transcriptional LysR family regulator